MGAKYILAVFSDSQPGTGSYAATENYTATENYAATRCPLIAKYADR
jgi:hypothetical protein